MSKFLETVFEIVGWIQIAISPLLIGAGIGAIIYYRNPTKTTLAAGIAVGILGLLIGILWANKVWQSKKAPSILSQKFLLLRNWTIKRI